MSIATSSPCARSGNPGLTNFGGTASACPKSRRMGRAEARPSAASGFAVAFCKMPVLSFSRVAANCLHLSSPHGGLGQSCRERTAANPRKRGVRRIGRLQVIQLPWRRRAETQPIHHLEPERFSHQGARGPAQCAIGANRRGPRDRGGAVEHELHLLPCPIPIRRAQPARSHCAP